MHWLKAAVVAAVVLLPASAIAAEKIAIPSETPKSLADLIHHAGAPTTVVGYLYLPKQASGPVPALILKHGSGGLDGPTGDNIRRWAETLANWGVAAFVVDSFGPRHITQTGTDQAQLSSAADLADALSALKVLAADPRIDATRIGVMGWSRGGGPAMLSALDSTVRNVLGDGAPRFAAHIVLYGPAMLQYRDKATDGAPFLFLHGGADDYVPVGPTREWADWIRSMGNAVTFVAYPGAYHDFDVEGTPDGFNPRLQNTSHCDAIIDVSTTHVLRLDHKPPPASMTPQIFADYMRSCSQLGATLRYNRSGREDAVEQVHAFLRQVFHLPA